MSPRERRYPGDKPTVEIPLGSMVTLTEHAKCEKVRTLGDLRELLRRVPEWPDESRVLVYGDAVVSVSRNLSA